MADLFLSSGMRAKGRFYSHDRRRVKFDNYLQERGFTLYNISLWQGPLSKQVANLIEAGVVRPAVNADGEPVRTHPCPTDVLQNETFWDAYREMVRHRLSAANDGEWVVYDYEPWGAPSNYCFCEKTLRDFKGRFELRETLTPDVVKDKYRKEWTEFWLQTTTEVVRRWTQAVHAFNPTLKISEYTYVFDYSDPNLHARFYDIPKDPRRIGPFVDEYMPSIYNYHGRRLFDSLSENIQALDKPVTPIALIACPHELMAYGTPAGTLSPQEIYQRAILVASLGCPRMAVYPGKWIDGAFHEALGRASRLIWAHEAFFLEGERRDGDVEVTPTGGARDDYAHVLWRKGGEYLLAIYNFKDAPLTLRIDMSDLEGEVDGLVDHNGHTYKAPAPLDISIAADDVLLLRTVK